jgi:hypothetical protein
MPATTPRFAVRGYQPRIIGYRKNGCPIREVAGGAPTIEDLVMSIDVELEQEQKRYERASAEAKMILAKAKNDGRPNLTQDEDADIEAAMRTRAQAKVNIESIRHKQARAKAIKDSEDNVELLLRERSADPVTADARKPAYDRVARVGSEERTYHVGMDRKGGGFVRDVVKQFLYRDMDAEQRLVRHMQEERVERGQYLQRTASATGNFAGLTVPQYLTDMYAPAVANLRPFADVCNHHDLPPNGMTVNISRIGPAAGGGQTAVALQAAENNAVADGSIDDTLLTENVQTAAGQQTLSRQAIDRGTGVEEITMDDLFRRYATTLDATLIAQATTGLAAVSASQSFTTASPTAAQTYGALVAGAASVESVLLGWAQPDTVVMHSRRWYKLLSAISAAWPMMYSQNPPDPVQALGVNAGLGYAKGIRGTLANGLRVCVDNNISTVCLGTLQTTGNQDQIYVVPSQECHLWEDPAAPVFIRAEQPAAANLGVLLVLYGYFAYSFRRFTNATININGTALAPPVYDGT